MRHSARSSCALASSNTTEVAFGDFTRDADSRVRNTDTFGLFTFRLVPLTSTVDHASPFFNLIGFTGTVQSGNGDIA